MPFKSEAQRRFFHAAEARGDLPPGTAHDWEKHTPKGKKLPERLHKKAFWQGFEKEAISASAYAKAIKPHLEKDVIGTISTKILPKFVRGVFKEYLSTAGPGIRTLEQIAKGRRASENSVKRIFGFMGAVRDITKKGSGK